MNSSISILMLIITFIIGYKIGEFIVFIRLLSCNKDDFCKILQKIIKLRQKLEK